jgi:protein transport protein SEC31
MRLGTLDRTAAMAWCPLLGSPPLLALGTIAGAMDASFSSQTELELYEISPSSGDSFKRTGSMSINARYHLGVTPLSIPC